MRGLCASLLSLWVTLTLALPTHLPATLNGASISASLFSNLEELARLVDISYCVGTSGIHPPFQCLSRCADFAPHFELVTTWNTGPLMSDSSGYIALSHEPFERRVIVAFRGTYSIANTIADLSTTPAEYMPFPGDGENKSVCTSATDGLGDHNTNLKEQLLPQLNHQSLKRDVAAECPNCTVHSGFLTSWLNTRCTIIPHVERALLKHPDYKLVLVGHSLGGAVAALAALEFQARGWDPYVTTFGEPRVGNKALARFIDKRFNLNWSSTGDARSGEETEMKYRRVTHVDDPVPLLPLKEWGYRMHAGEIFISKSSLPPSRADLQHCTGDEDPSCIENSASTDDAPTLSSLPPTPEVDDLAHADDVGELGHVKEMWELGRRYKLWELFFAHRDYFWRLGLCVPGGDPWDWRRGRYNDTDGVGEEINDEL
jgi:hypothetical protein